MVREIVKTRDNISSKIFYVSTTTHTNDIEMVSSSYQPRSSISGVKVAACCEVTIVEWK